jgi:ubiquinol-cytochrome c reductase cytochrome b subunit
MVRRIGSWFESRTALGAVLRAFLSENVPATVGWRNTLGSVVGALLLVQMITGVLLALYYVPHPEAAFESIAWVEQHVTLGAFVRALHYWGASFAIVAALAHMMRVYFTGAYRPPREINWLIGLALLVVVVTISFTGQLLPYNQIGYWAATVGIEIVSAAPIVGGTIRELMTGGDTVGALTLTRFYAVHVVALPALLGVLVVWHLYLLRRHGPMRPANDTAGATEPFFPRPFFRDMVAISVGLLALVVVCVFVGGPDSPPLDLSDETYTPRPEWYFLAHYELLRLTQGEFQKVLVAFVLPTVLMLALALLPWLDRGKTSAMRHRRPVVAAGVLLIAGSVGLTAYGLATAPSPPAEQVTDAARSGEDPIALGRRVYREQQCFKCHMVNGVGAEIGPDLTIVGLRIHEAFMREWLQDPKSFKPTTVMPPVKITPEKFEALVAYLKSLTEVPAAAPDAGEGTSSDAAQ